MYERLEENTTSIQTEKQKPNSKNSNCRTNSPSFQTDTMNAHLENCTTKYLHQHDDEQHQEKHCKKSSHQSFWEKKRINCIVRNQHSRATKNPTTTSWLRCFTLFKTKYKQEPLQRRHQQQQQQNYLQKQEYRQQSWLLLTTVIVLSAIIADSMPVAKADSIFIDDNENGKINNTTITTTTTTTVPVTHLYHDNLVGTSKVTETSTMIPNAAHNESLWLNNSTHNVPTSTGSSARPQKKLTSKYNEAEDSIFLRIAKRFTADNNLWSGIIQDCYKRPTFSCFQKNVYYYLNDVLDATDVNVTQRLKIYKNENSYQDNMEEAKKIPTPLTHSSLAVDSMENVAAEDESDVENNEIPYRRSARTFTGEFMLENGNLAIW